MEILQQEMYKMKRVETRKRLIETYRETRSIRKAAKLWGTGRISYRTRAKTAMTWVRILSNRTCSGETNTHIDIC